VNPQLHEAIEVVYHVFKDVPRPRRIDGCPCCIDEKGVSILLSKPLRDVLPDELTHYAASVFLTVGSVEDFFYFIPRILEIRAREPYLWPDPEVIFKAFLASGFHSWPSLKKEAVLRYFDATIDDLLETDKSGSEIDSWICALGGLHVDLKPYLNKVAANKLRLIDFYEVNSGHLIEGRLANGFWNDAPDEYQLVLNWFQSPEIKKSINLAYGLS
jgi:hypothetical protein